MKFLYNMRYNNSYIREWLKLKNFELFFPDYKILKINNKYEFFNKYDITILNPQNTQIDNAKIEIKNNLDKSYINLKQSYRESQKSLISSSPSDNDNNDNNNISINKTSKIKNLHKNDYDSKIYNKNNNYNINNNNNIDEIGQNLNPKQLIIKNQKNNNRREKIEETLLLCM